MCLYLCGRGMQYPLGLLAIRASGTSLMLSHSNRGSKNSLCEYTAWSFIQCEWLHMDKPVEHTHKNTHFVHAYKIMSEHGYWVYRCTTYPCWSILFLYLCMQAFLKRKRHCKVSFSYSSFQKPISQSFKKQPVIWHRGLMKRKWIKYPRIYTLSLADVLFNFLECNQDILNGCIESIVTVLNLVFFVSYFKFCWLWSINSIIRTTHICKINIQVAKSCLCWKQFGKWLRKKFYLWRY